MAGPPNGSLMSAADAKARLRELGARNSAAAALLGNPAVRAGAFLLGGLLLGRVVGGRGKEGAGTSLRRMAMRAGLAAAPLLVEQFVRGLASHAPRPSRHSTEASQGAPDRLTENPP